MFFIATFISLCQVSISFQLCFDATWKLREHMDEMSNESAGAGEKDPFYFTNKNYYIVIISLVTSMTMFRDVQSQYAMMMKCKNPIYVILAFLSTFANFYVCIAIMITNLKEEKIM